jgi:CheY-like chemotaxis protein
MAEPKEDPQEIYEIRCYHCGRGFDALQAPFCTCLSPARTFVCPHCGQCFCKAPQGHQKAFWAAAPATLWRRKTLQRHGAQTQLRAQPSPESVTRPLVLVVEDDPETLHVASEVIGRLGYGVIAAGNGEEGLRLAQAYRPELVLTDALMPKMDGRELCLRLKQLPATSHAKIVVMTSVYVAGRYRSEAMTKFRADEYLLKPLDFQKLRQTLERMAGEAAPAP